MKQNVYRQRKLRQVDGTAIKETLRNRASGKLPYFTISHKTYYRAADIRTFIQENTDSKTHERFKKGNQLDKQTEAKQGE